MPRGSRRRISLLPTIWNRRGGTCGTGTAAKKRFHSQIFQRRNESLLSLKLSTAKVPSKRKLSALAPLARAGSAAAAAVPALIPMLNTAHQALRTSAIYSLAAIGEPAVDALCHLLEKVGERASSGEESPDFDSRWIALHDAAYALGAMGAPAVEPLMKLLASPHEWTRMNAAFALGEMDSEAASAVPALEAVLQDESHYVIRVATNSLGDYPERCSH